MEEERDREGVKWRSTEKEGGDKLISKVECSLMDELHHRERERERGNQ